MDSSSITVKSPALGMQGLFKFEVFKGTVVDGKVVETSGSRRVVADWFPNLILDAGRNIMNDHSNWATGGSACQVGTSGTVPTTADTGLIGFVIGTTNIHDSSFGSEATPPYFGWEQTTYRFIPGEATGNLSEVGVGWSALTGPYLISRALITDGLGAPTTITVLADEYLDVTYQLRYYPPLEDVEGTITLNGVVYNTITRASSVNSELGLRVGTALGEYSPTPASWQAYDGNIGSLVQAPSGTSAACDNADQSNQPYSNNSYEIDMLCNCGATGWNLGAGIRSIRISTTAGNFQTQFNAQSDDSRIPKDINFTMSMTWKLTWAGWYWAYAYEKQANSDSVTPTTGNWNYNTAKTLLRINWDDAGAVDRQVKLQVETDVLFRITEDGDATKWAQFRGSVLYSEGADWTEYAGAIETEQNGGPTTGQACTITAVDF